MPAFWAWALLIGGLVIVAGLAVYVGYLMREIKRREALRYDEMRRANENCLESLDVIARAMLADQVDLIEGCLRCCVMLDILDPALLKNEELQVFQFIQSEASHLHTHQARAELSPHDRMSEDRERLQLMALHRENILAGARHVLTLTKKHFAKSA